PAGKVLYNGFQNYMLFMVRLLGEQFLLVPARPALFYLSHSSPFCQLFENIFLRTFFELYFLIFQTCLQH
ncbi:MAG: hypothetical protein N2235_22720, partial [Fischerella sp.]|nr:hypothetical protein [Fischerella sp.]